MVQVRTLLTETLTGRIYLDTTDSCGPTHVSDGTGDDWQYGPFLGTVVEASEWLDLPTGGAWKQIIYYVRRRMWFLPPVPEPWPPVPYAGWIGRATRALRRLPYHVRHRTRQVRLYFPKRCEAAA